MTKRNRYHITKTDDGWKGKKVGAKRSSVTSKTKADAVKQTTDIAKRKGNSSVVIHKEDGKFQEERTYPKGSDPHPPKG